MKHLFLNIYYSFIKVSILFDVVICYLFSYFHSLIVLVYSIKVKNKIIQHIHASLWFTVIPFLFELNSVRQVHSLTWNRHKFIQFFSSLAKLQYSSFAIFHIFFWNPGWFPFVSFCIDSSPFNLTYRKEKFLIIETNCILIIIFINTRQLMYRCSFFFPSTQTNSLTSSICSIFSTSQPTSLFLRAST